MTNFELASVCSLWISAIRNTQLQTRAFFENAENVERNLERFLKLMDTIKQKLIFITDSEKEIDAILKFINKNIYQGSIEVAKELMMTNMPSLSSCLNLEYK